MYSHVRISRRQWLDLTAGEKMVYSMRPGAGGGGGWTALCTGSGHHVALHTKQLQVSSKDGEKKGKGVPPPPPPTLR